MRRSKITEPSPAIPGNNNTASGSRALSANSTGDRNTANGGRALRNNNTGSDNTANGYQALVNNRTIAGDPGNFNTASGSQALSSNSTGDNNTAVGFQALSSNSTGRNNTAIGFEALLNSTGDGNIAIGSGAGRNVTTGRGNIMIGVNGPAADDSFVTMIGQIYGKTTRDIRTLNVLIDQRGQLGTATSSRRHKEDIEDMAGASDSLLNLRPVTFRYKKAFVDGDKPIQYGLIAEEVAEVFSDLVVYNDDGEPEAVKYRLLSTLLLNEFQKLEQVTADQEAQLVSLVEQNRAYESERERLVALEAKVAELTALTARLAQSATPDSKVQLGIELDRHGPNRVTGLTPEHLGSVPLCVTLLGSRMTACGRKRPLISLNS